ncbi:choline ABC transporter ATP-binding protein [Salinarimonas rosea]|uniref:choline ABC transporter ATP-binding protein n=1 Tax=Salinarimonas rosea TaxID=552063 RepID=UPI0004132865|nr:choline ABC transporter ATP-binding protein [Salinarimonas rosea]
MTGQPTTRDIAVRFEHVDVVFGGREREALARLDRGEDRETIQRETGAIVGVADANLAVAEGEISVLMGLSGSGKSSLLRCVNGLNRVSRGRVLVSLDGEEIDVASCRPADLKRLRGSGVAMVFQQFALLPWRTVAQNVGFGLEVNGRSKAEIDRVVAEKLALVGLSDWAGAYGHELSGGMQQRVGLARAFAMDAPILLMDEPFSALDPLIRSKLQDELVQLQKELKKTILFVSHDLDEAMKIGDRISIMESGRIVQTGTPEDIALAPANAYVAEFVAHMNPVNVLRGQSLMTPLEALTRLRDGRLVAEPGSGVTLEIAEDGAVAGARIDGRGPAPVRIWEGEASHAVASPADAVVVVSPDVTLREAMEIRRLTGAILVVAKDGRALGVLGEKELYDGVLGATERPEPAADPREGTSSAA